MKNRAAKSTAAIDIQLFHQAIEDLRNKTKLRSFQTDKRISQVKGEGIEILNSQLVRQTVVVWIWCRSQAAIEYIQKKYESNNLRDALFGLADIRPPTSAVILSAEVNIDTNQFKKAVGKF